MSKGFLTVNKPQIDLYIGDIISKYAIIKHPGQLQYRPCIHKGDL